MTQNQEEKFSQTYESLFPKMVSYAGRLCRDREEAEDITQEAFIKAFAAFEHCNDDRHLDNWLMKIVYNTFLDRRRKAGRRPQTCNETNLGTELIIENHASDEATPETKLFKKLIDPRILKALKTLDQKSQEIFRMVYIDEVDQKTVGQRFGMKVGAVRSRLHRVCSKLRMEMGNKMMLD